MSYKAHFECYEITHSCKFDTVDSTEIREPMTIENSQENKNLCYLLYTHKYIIFISRLCNYIAMDRNVFFNTNAVANATH